ncbi:bile acid:sodium symporter [Spirochaetia bacterium 38H-sp]|uniref:Bile acid:sodium symporter n=1 Tax=Rarispira pelagica TaxID=3141764 RepID=A0ABU9UBU1_9SPIR
MDMIQRLTEHLKKNLMWYALLSIAVGWSLGVLFPGFVVANKSVLSVLITVFVFMMIYPMMINLNLEKIPGVLKKPKPIIMTVLYNFVITPLISILLVKLFIHDQEIALGFMLVMLIPGSSMSLGYTGLVEGGLEIATVAMGFIFVLIPIFLPFFIHILGKAYNIAIPLGLLLKTVVLVLIVPMFAGDITRRIIIKSKGENGFKKIKPLFSFISMITMLFMVTLIFMLKAPVLFKNWTVVVNLAFVTLIYLAIMFPLMTVVNKLFKIDYKEHMAIAFLSTGKNNGTAIAIAMLAFSAMVAIPAAILPLFQIIFSIAYVHLHKKIREYFDRGM